MTAEEYCEHKRREHQEYQRKMLRKMANNPVISEEFQNVLWNAIWNIDLVDFYRDLFVKERGKNDGRKV